MSHATLRPATAEDIPLILDLIRRLAEFDGSLDSVQATPDSLRQSLFGDSPCANVILAYRNQEAVGFASYFHTFSTFLAKPGIWLDDLFVLPAYRNQGIGRQLMAYLARLADSKGYGRIDWIVSIHNPRGAAFYANLGAEISESTRLCRLDSDSIRRLARTPA